MRRYCVLVHLGTATPPRRQPPLTKLVACAKPPIQRRSEPSGPVSPDKDSRNQATRKEATQDSNAEDSHLAPPRRSLLVREKQFANVVQHNAGIYSKRAQEGKGQCPNAPDSRNSQNCA